jgi:hypothetical protein
MTRPPLYKMYEEVQMRFTLGQMCSHCSRSPAIVSAAPATRRPRSFSAVDRAAFSHSPDHMPNIMVASVGMKLRVDQPLSLKRTGPRVETIQEPDIERPRTQRFADRDPEYGEDKELPASLVLLDAAMFRDASTWKS